MMQPHQQMRIRVALGIEDDLRGGGYNVDQSKIAIGAYDSTYRLMAIDKAHTINAAKRPYATKTKSTDTKYDSTMATA
ncbi:hypothetical protein, partial [Porphyromonas gingivalis]|uniref:hypothetical protein n=1 Tax=Porphyromonas gingivalis TaxID=837 RepID=UPI0015CF14DA